MDTSRVWDFWAEKYEKLWVQKYSLGPTRRTIIAQISQIMKKGQKYKILDMGCGTGQLLREMQEAFREYDIDYTGVDISPKMIAVAKEKSEGINYKVSNIESFEVEDESYNVIVCSHSFPYYRSKEKMLLKFYRFLKKDGFLLLAQASQNNLYDKLILFFVKFTTSSAEYPSVNNMRKLLESSFKINNIIKIKEKPYMPTICLFLSQKGD